jgi:hypothetical protein
VRPIALHPENPALLGRLRSVGTQSLTSPCEDARATALSAWAARSDKVFSTARNRLT